MISAHNLPKAIQWHEGMLLAPQHFQQLTLRQEELIHYHLLLATPYHYGVRLLKIDPVLLVNGTYRVLELEAVMPDGLIVNHSTQTGAELEIDLNKHIDSLKQGALFIYLTVPAQKMGGSAMRGQVARYVSDAEDIVVDENTGEGKLRVPRMRPQIRLLISGQPPENKLVSMPLTQISYANERFEETQFIPPQLKVTHNTELGKLCLELAKRLREKAIFLTKKVQSPVYNNNAPLLMETKMLVQSLVLALPQFEAMLHSQQMHPFPLYLGLCQLVGATALAGPSLIPPVLPAYDHNNLMKTFQLACNFTINTVEQGVVESHSVLPFDKDNGAFKLQIKGEWMQDSLVIGLTPPPSTDEDRMIDWIHGAFIAGQSRIEELQSMRTAGMQRQQVERVGDFVPAKGVVLFELKADEKLLTADEVLVIDNLSDPEGYGRPSDIVYYVKNQ